MALESPEGQLERWFLTRGRAIKDEDGKPERYFGVIIDVTEQKLMEDALRASEERQCFLLALNDAFCSIKDPLEAMAGAGEMLGRKLAASQVVYAEIDESVSMRSSRMTGTTA